MSDNRLPKTEYRKPIARVLMFQVTLRELHRTTDELLMRVGNLVEDHNNGEDADKIVDRESECGYVLNDLDNLMHILAEARNEFTREIDLDVDDLDVTFSANDHRQEEPS
jgi:hypothetical protein